MNYGEWKHEMKTIAPDLNDDLDALWRELNEAVPSSDVQMEKRIWKRLTRSSSPWAVFIRAWRLSWSMMPARRLLVLIACPFIAWLAVRAIPLSHQTVAWAWWGMLSPVAGLLAVPFLNRTWEGSGPWSDWEEAAPLDAGLRLAADWLAMMLLMAFLAVVGALTEGVSLGDARMVLMWMGPYAITSIVAALLVRKMGTVWAMALTSSFWGMQLVAGALLATRHELGWMLWFANLRAPLWPELGCIGVGIALALSLIRSRAWSFKS